MRNTALASSGVECSSAHTKGLVLPHKTLDVDNLQMMVLTNKYVTHAFNM